MSQVIQHQSEGLVAIVVTDAAKSHLINYLTSQQDAIGIRVSVKKTGCSGMSYVLDYIKTPQDSDLEFPFAANYFLYVDRASYPYLKGVTIDYQKQGFNYKLVFNNPNQTGLCGCGESFTIE